MATTNMIDCSENRQTTHLLNRKKQTLHMCKGISCSSLRFRRNFSSMLSELILPDWDSVQCEIMQIQRERTWNHPSKNHKQWQEIFVTNNVKRIVLDFSPSADRSNESTPNSSRVELQYAPEQIPIQFLTIHDESSYNEEQQQTTANHDSTCVSGSNNCSSGSGDDARISPLRLRDCRENSDDDEDDSHGSMLMEASRTRSSSKTHLISASIQGDDDMSFKSFYHHVAPQRSQSSTSSQPPVSSGTSSSSKSALTGLSKPMTDEKKKVFQSMRCLALKQMHNKQREQRERQQ